MLIVIGQVMLVSSRRSTGSGQSRSGLENRDKVGIGLGDGLECTQSEMMREKWRRHVGGSRQLSVWAQFGKHLLVFHAEAMRPRA